MPVFDNKDLLLHASEKQKLIRNSRAKAIAPTFTVHIIAHDELERQGSLSALSELDARKIVEGLRPVLYRSKILRNSWRMKRVLIESGLYEHFEKRQEKPRSAKLELCISAIQKCLTTNELLPAFRFLQMVAKAEEGEIGHTLELVLESSLFNANASIQSSARSSKVEPLFSFPKPRIFFGRKSVLSELIDAVLNHRLITVFGGIGGLGKTTLACQAAVVLHEQGDFSGGIIFVDLEEATTAQSALLRICKSLRLHENFTTEEIIRNLEGRSVLLIIDNIEAVLLHDRMEFRKLIGSLLDYTIATILCTGREFINRPDEKLITPKPLDRQEAEALLAFHLALRSGEASEGVKPKGFDAALDICDGIPLAIELVASWLPGHSLDSYVAEFRRFRAAVLRNPSLEKGDRLTNYVISTHLTYSLLPSCAQELLRYVAMLPAAPRLEMLPPLLNQQQGLALHELGRRNLINRDGNHIRALVPVREAIRSLVMPSEITTLAAYILEKIPQGTQDLEDLVLEQHSNLTWSIVNVLACPDHVLNLSGLSEIVLRIEAPYVRAGLLVESKEILESLVAQCKSRAQPISFRLHCFRGNIERLLDNYTASESCYAEALGEAALSGIERARTLIGHGNVQKQIQKYAEAKRSFEEALKISLSLGADPALRGECLWGLANIEFATSQWEEARSSYTRALSAFEQARPSPETIRGIIDCHKGLCDIYIKQRSLLDAEASISAAYEMFYDPYFEFKNKFTEAKIQQGMGDVKRLLFISAKQRGSVSKDEDYKFSEESYRKAISLYREMKAPIGEALSWYKLGELSVFSPSGEEKARGCFLTAASIFDGCGNHLGRAKASLAILKLDIIEHGSKHRFLERAHELLGIFRDICRSLYWQAEAHLVIAACRRHGEADAARDLAEATRLYTDLRRDDKLKVVEMVRIGDFGVLQAFWE